MVETAEQATSSNRESGEIEDLALKSEPVDYESDEEADEDVLLFREKRLTAIGFGYMGGLSAGVLWDNKHYMVMPVIRSEGKEKALIQFRNVGFNRRVRQNTYAFHRATGDGIDLNSSDLNPEGRLETVRSLNDLINYVRTH